MTPDRYSPEIVFPEYAFVPGRHPHPITDVRGHSFGRPQVDIDALDPESPLGSRDYLHAIDLFNAGFYWEAHEAWEGLWIASGRAGVTALFLKGLIKLAAAGVKSREGSVTGVQRHARRSAELFETVRNSAGPQRDIYAGLSISQLIQAANDLSERPIVDKTPTIAGLPVLNVRLILASPARDVST